MDWQKIILQKDKIDYFKYREFKEIFAINKHISANSIQTNVKFTFIAYGYMYRFIYIYISFYICIYIYDETHYIDIQSDHPPSITKQLLKKFYKTAQYYEQRPASCGYNEKLTYQQQGENIGNIKNMRKNRKRNIVWFNPPYNKSLKTNIGKYFFRLRTTFFHQVKIFNKNTLKLSYSCMLNLKAKIDGHNKKILETKPLPTTKLCNCLKKNANERSLPH